MNTEFFSSQFFPNGIRATCVRNNKNQRINLFMEHELQNHYWSRPKEASIYDSSYFLGLEESWQTSNITHKQKTAVDNVVTC